MFTFKKKALVVISLMIVLAFALSACGGSAPAPSGDKGPAPAPTAPAAPGPAPADKLKVGVDDSYPPMEFKDKDGKTTIGFDVDVANEVAKRMGRSGVEFVSNDWTGIFDALETNKFDVIISSVSINEDRQKNHSLSNAYIANKLVIVTKKDKNTVKTPADLKGKKVGVQAGTTSEEFCRDLVKENKFEEKNLATYPLVTQPFMDLDAGRIEAIVVDIVVAKYYLANNKDKYIVSWESPDAEPMAFCFKKKDTVLRDQANKIIEDMQKDGTMKKISEKWFGEDVTKNLK